MDARTLFERDDPVTIAHRGGALLRPENTLPAFDHAVEVGADCIELDVHQTADGHLVVHHDPTIDRTTDGEGAIAEVDLETLQSHEAGHHFSPDGDRYPYRGENLSIPRLETVLERYEVPLLIELKGSDVDPDDFVSLVETTDRRDSVIIGGFDDAVLQAVRDRAPLVTGLGLEESQALVETDPTTVDPPGEILFPPVDMLSEEVVQIGNAADLAVAPWTVNEPDAIQRSLDLGVDGVVTDDPATMLDLLD